MDSKANVIGVVRARRHSSDVELGAVKQLPPEDVFGAAPPPPRQYIVPMQSLFGLSLDELCRYPGIWSYCQYLEACFGPLLAPDYESMWTALGERAPVSTPGCWLAFGTILSALKPLPVSGSIRDIWVAIPERNGRNRPSDLLASYLTVFSVLCWATMTLKPILYWPDFKDQPCLKVDGQTLLTDFQKIEIVTRPVSAVFHQFHKAMVITRWRSAIGGGNAEERSVALEVASLNFASLRDIGKINLTWVDDLSCHLDFDPVKRQLSVFRFPSFCAVSVLARKHGSVPPIIQATTDNHLSSILRGFVGTGADVADVDLEFDTNTQLHQEVLMSYRLLFGQKRVSQRLGRALLKMQKENKPNEYDCLLDLVCTHPNDRHLLALPVSLWPVTCRTFDGQLQEQSSYSSQDDFPLLGQRLAKLQDFTLRQQPGKLSDLWRDRRNPLQWYTFWAVLIFGGLSLLLGLLQAFVGIAQLVVAMCQASP